MFNTSVMKLHICGLTETVEISSKPGSESQIWQNYFRESLLDPRVFQVLQHVVFDLQQKSSAFFEENLK